MKNKKLFTKNNRGQWIIALMFAILFVLTIISILYFNYQTKLVNSLIFQDYDNYTSHYAFISDNMYDAFWQEVFEGAKTRGEEMNIRVERFGENIKNDYSKTELFRMAIAADVDGIILQGGDSPEIRELMLIADEKDIPVVSVLTDISDGRKSFIGIPAYNLGNAYAREVIRVSDEHTKKVLLLTEKNKEEKNQQMVYTSMKETIAQEGGDLELEIENLSVDNYSAFSAEETIRDIFLNTEEAPDIIVCLNEKNTISAYQAAVDYNMVDVTEIIGYYTSPTILNAIEKQVVASTIAVDSEEMGTACIDTLHAYLETGHVTDYVAINVKAVTIDNVEEFKEDANGEKDIQE